MLERWKTKEGYLEFLDIENKLYELEIEEVTNCSFILKLTDKEYENFNKECLNQMRNGEKSTIEEKYPLKKEGKVGGL